ncbi:hypothetical protein MTR67_035788 [Solanum verrucosum]|uniref:Uncharacterized protein n=1 Tax=Solanum verrucosum TaxID=315347 RepID=A0AAF0UAS6_SOLVR|nr:hypothetical protein MTR67_035788 [Solanum verrucosum]
MAPTSITGDLPFDILTEIGPSSSCGIPNSAKFSNLNFTYFVITVSTKDTGKYFSINIAVCTISLVRT